MDTVGEFLLGGVVRTTCCTTLAALAALFLLKALRIRSTSIHRIAWVLVIAQGWILMPLTLKVERPRNALSQHAVDASTSRSEPMSPSISPFTPKSVHPPLWRWYGKPVATLAWLFGILAMLGFYATRYYSLVVSVPFGGIPEATEWKQEWLKAKEVCSVSANVQLRVTTNLGPLLCFVPYLYLILVPRQLWISLSQQGRIAILHHELAHLRRGDLWKNLAVRILALPQWFNPLVWLAVRRFEEAGEWACDEEVLSLSSASSTDYANTLLHVAGFSTGSPCGTVAASGGVLTRRVTRLLSSTDKEVSLMKNFAVPLLLLGIGAFQAIRIDTVLASGPDHYDAVAARADAVEKWRAAPYLIEPPDVLSIELSWTNFDSKLSIERTPTLKGNWQFPELSMSGVQVLHQVEKGTRIRARKVQLQGEFLVGPDGKLNIAGLAQIHYIAGKTLDEAKQALAEGLPKEFGTPEISLDLAQSNSKVVYLIDKCDSGDDVVRIPLPHSGQLSILDILTHLSQDHEKIDQLYIAGTDCDTEKAADRLIVDLDVLFSEDNESVDYPLLPGDRIFMYTKSKTSKQQDASPVVPPTEVNPYE